MSSGLMHLKKSFHSLTKEVQLPQSEQQKNKEQLL